MMSSDLVVVWRITEKCNLGCKFCAYDRMLDRSRSEARAEQVIRFGTLLHAYRMTTKRNILVSWLGGEPLAWKPVFDVARQYRHEFGMRVSATTNGTTLQSGRTREQILKHFDELTVSIDGLEAEHDRLRGRQGLFEEVRSGMTALIDQRNREHSPLWLRANTVLMHHTIRNFEALCCELAGWGVTEVSFNTLGGRERPEFFPANRLSVEDVAWFAKELPRIRARLQTVGLRILGNARYLERAALLARNVPVPIQDCLPGRQYLFIDEKGMIAPCNYTVAGYGISVEQLHTVEELKSLPEMFSAQKQAHMLAPCFDCQSTHVFEKFAKQSTHRIEMEAL